jgi:hypothetical protein
VGPLPKIGTFLSGESLQPFRCSGRRVHHSILSGAN